MPADRFPMRHLAPNRVSVAGSFEGNGTSAPTKKTGVGFTVSRVSQGRYRVTLDDRYYALESVVLSLGANSYTNVSKYKVYADQSLTDNQKFDIYVYDSQATPALADLASAEFCMFQAVLKNTGVRD